MNIDFEAVAAHHRAQFGDPSLEVRMLKVVEEVGELQHAERFGFTDRIVSEAGDVFIALVSLVCKLGVDPGEVFETFEEVTSSEFCMGALVGEACDMAGRVVRVCEGRPEAGWEVAVTYSAGRMLVNLRALVTDRAFEDAAAKFLARTWDTATTRFEEEKAIRIEALTFRACSCKWLVGADASLNKQEDPNCLAHNPKIPEGLTRKACTCRSVRVTDLMNPMLDYWALDEDPNCPKHNPKL